jgi:uncharacterized protein (DUF2141 family)
VVSCANPIPPTGGPRDLDPPVLLATSPDNKSLNYNEPEISLEFNEYIKEENLLTQLMITPNLKGNYNYRVNRNRIVLTFDEPFDSATTYTLNFREGIKDITEGNVPPNLKFVFSTGSFLDSASVNGTTRSLMTKELLEDITVSLYVDPDTITVFDSPPRYSTITDENGVFSIENIKNGNYLLYAFNDKNHNLKLESRTEGYGYLDQAIALNDSLPPLELWIYNLDTRPIVLQNSRPVTGNYDLKFNKALSDYRLLDDQVNLFSNLVEDNQTLRIYYNELVQDSLAVRFTVTDSLQQSLDSLVYVKFEESSRKPEEFTHNISLKSGPVNKQWKTKLKFNKPLKQILYDSIYFRFDSLLQIQLADSAFTVNYSKDEYEVQFDFKEYLKDDTVYNNWSGDFQFILAAGSIISVEHDSISRQVTDYSFKDPKDFGIIRGAINTQYGSYWIQLVDNKFDVIEQLSSSQINGNKYEFLHVEPGNYSIRVLFDENNNGRWDPGNILEKIPPEKVELFHHPNSGGEIINLRANWEQTGLDIVF